MFILVLDVIKVHDYVSPSSGQSEKSNLSPNCVCACVFARMRVRSMYLLQKSELLGNVMSTVFILAKGKMFFIC